MDVSVHGMMFLLFVLLSPIQAVSKLQIIFTDQTHHIEIGSEVRLTCVVIGGNNPHVTWISPKGQLPSNTMTEHNGQTLVISGFDTRDIGQYICVASDGMQFANHVFTVTLSGAGNVTQTTLKHTTFQSESTTTPKQHLPTQIHHVTTPKQQGTTQIQHVTTTTPKQHVTTQIQYMTIPKQQVTTPTKQVTLQVTTTSLKVTTPTHQVTTRIFATLPKEVTSEPPSFSPLPTTSQTNTTSQSVKSTLPNTQSPAQTTGLNCMMCQDVVSPAFCTHSIQCGNHEECYLQEYLRDGRVLYMQGCMSKFACRSIQSPVGLLGRRRQSDGVVLCESCCSDYNRCNLGGLCHTPGVPPKVLDLSVSPSKIHLGDDVEVKCNALGVPKPSIHWSVLASSYPSNLRFHEENGVSVLKILNFNPNDEHLYRCTAENINGEDTKTVTLRIY